MLTARADFDNLDKVLLPVLPPDAHTHGLSRAFTVIYSGENLWGTSGLDLSQLISDERRSSLIGDRSDL